MFRKFFSKIKSVGEDIKPTVTKRFGVDYNQITAKMIATENGIDYVHCVTVSTRGDGNGYYARHGVYVLLYPPNDGRPTTPFKWYNGSGKFVLDNQSAFKCITNLSDIILDMIKLYTKYIDEDVFIASMGFAIKLEGEVVPGYNGRARLALTKDAVRNHKVKPEQKEEAKKYLINDFLDHYIGWNFGVVVKNNPELEKALLEFNELVISKGLREYAGPGLEVWQSDDVMPYKLKTV